MPERIVRLFKVVARSMAIELAPYGIQLNAIAPGCIEADLTGNSFVMLPVDGGYLVF